MSAKNTLSDNSSSVGAWILTGGTHSGVMMHVGQAVREYALSNTMQGQVVAIGVATWGVIHNRDKLVHEEVRRTQSSHYAFAWICVFPS